MTCRGIVKQGKVELEPGVSLPEGTQVRVEALGDASEVIDDTSIGADPDARAWLTEWRRFAQEAGAVCQDGPSLVETLRQLREESDAR